MSDIINGKDKPCRQATTFNHYLECKGISDTLPADEKMIKLNELFGMFAAGARAVLDNLQPEEIEQRLASTKIPSSLSEMKQLGEAAEHSMDLLKQCLKKMALNPLTQGSETSFMFARCTQIFFEEEARFETGKKTLAGLLHSEPAQTPFTQTSGPQLRSAVG